jgi:hypothetical protein
VTSPDEPKRYTKRERILYGSVTPVFIGIALADGHLEEA